jgi:DNA-binding PadR family transcriptional regulator
MGKGDGSVSIRQGLLALLDEGQRYGYQLRQEFEARTGGTWPVNVGQVYTTLNRLERDGLVLETDRREDGSVLYGLTDAGRAEVALWWATPVRRGTPSRDELAIKLALAVSTEGVDVAAVVQQQRTESMRALQEYTRLKARVPDPAGLDDLAWLLVLDSLIFTAEAEVRWLDHAEQRIAASRAAGSRTGQHPTAGRRPRREGNVDEDRRVGSSPAAGAPSGPGAGSSGPGAGSSGPGAGASGPGAGSSGPGAGSSGPGAGSSGPGAGSSGPGAGSSGPGEGLEVTR